MNKRWDLSQWRDIQNWTKLWPWLLSATLIAFIATKIISLFFNTAPLTENQITSQLATPAKNAPSTAIQNLEPIVQAHLFGRQDSPPTAGQFKQAPDTKLPLKLHGIFTGDDERSGYAIILSKGKPQQYFSAGESVHGLATLQAIYVDHVVLQRAGKYETLILPQDQDQEMMIVVTKKGNSQTLDNSLPRLNEFEYHVSLESESDINSDTDALFGFSVEPATDVGRQWLKQLNLEPGDVIVEANGRALDSEDKIELLEQALEANDPVAITVDRNGTVFSATLVAPTPTGTE